MGSTDGIYKIHIDGTNGNDNIIHDAPLPSTCQNWILGQYGWGAILDWAPLVDEYDPNSPACMDIQQYSVTFTLTPASDPICMKRCADLPVTATLQGCGLSPIANNPVTFTLGSGSPAVFVENNAQVYTRNTNSSGQATATIHWTGPDPNQEYPVGFMLTVSANVHGDTPIPIGKSVYVMEFSPAVTVEPATQSIYAAAEPLVTFHAANVDGTARSGFHIQASTTAGTLQNPIGTTLSNPTTLTTNASGDAQVYVLLSTPQSATVTGSFTDDCIGAKSIDAKIRYCQQPWIPGVGTDYSSPLVADLVPGDGQEVAVISNSGNGSVYVWNSTGTAIWSPSTSPASPQADSSGGNTLSAANIDNNSSNSLRLVVPYRNSAQMRAYGYDGSFKPLAGWPIYTPQGYQFYGAAAALGDANLDGTTKVVAGDESCFVMCWNGVGQTLWQQVTGNGNVTIDTSSVALGQINTTTNSNRPPVAVVGAEYTPGLWGFDGDEWHLYSGYQYTTRWTRPDLAGYSIGWIQTSPAIGPIDNDAQDSINDIAVGSDDGTLWVWLSKDSTWRTYSTGSHIYSSPALVDYNGQHLIVFGCDNGRVYVVRWNGTALVDAAGWSPSGTSGIPLDGSAIKASPVIGDVLGDTLNPSHYPQVVIASEQGSVYALWLDGTNHSGGAQAKTWLCTQYDTEQIHSTPALCSLNGSTVSLVVASTNDIYKIDLYSGTFDPVGNPSRWPWPTFHHDNARTGCKTTPSSTMVSSSIVGRVKSSSAWLGGASVQIQWYNTSTSSWVPDTPVYGRSGESRTNPVLTVGNGTNNDEINEGAFVINQLTPGRRYKLVVSKSGYTTQTVPIYSDQNIPVGKIAVSDITLQ